MVLEEIERAYTAKERYCRLDLIYLRPSVESTALAGVRASHLIDDPGGAEALETSFWVNLSGLAKASYQQKGWEWGQLRGCLMEEVLRVLVRARVSVPESLRKEFLTTPPVRDGGASFVDKDGRVYGPVDLVDVADLDL
jgi:hypothetical protein